MYCPNCATEIKPELHYCSSCGFRLKDGREKSESPVKSITTAIGFIGVAAVIGFVFLFNAMLGSGLHEPVIVMVSLIYFAAIFGICAYLLSYLKIFMTDSNPKQTSYKQPPVQLSAAETGKLEPGNPAPASVTEHTTRTLDKVPADRQ